MQNTLPALLQSVYATVFCTGSIAVAVALLIVFRRRSISRTWEPLVPIVKGTLERNYMTALLKGAYREHPVQATLVLGGQDEPDTFRIEITTPSRGTHWSVRYGSEKLFGKDQWYLKTSDESLKQRLSQASTGRNGALGKLPYDKLSDEPWLLAL